MHKGVHRQRKAPPTPSERFFAKVAPATDGSGCLLWTGSLSGGGYGQFGVAGLMYSSHRWMFERAYGPLPDGHCVDHLCRNRRCVRPSHLEVVTWAENVRRGLAPQITSDLAASRTHCRRGHALTPENLYVAGKSRRGCLTCRRDRERLYGARRAEHERVLRQRRRDMGAAYEPPQAAGPLKTHCKRGHEFSEENTFEDKATGRRACKICRRLAVNARRVRRKAEGLPR